MPSLEVTILVWIVKPFPSESPCFHILLSSDGLVCRVLSPHFNHSKSKASDLEETRCKESAEIASEWAGHWEGGWQPQGAYPGRHLGGQPGALKADSLDFTSDPTGMCAGGGAAEDVFRPRAVWHLVDPRHLGASLCSFSSFSSQSLSFSCVKQVDEF